MDLHYKQELRVGMLVIVGVLVFTLGMLWLSGKTIGTSGTVIVPVRFANVAGLRAGDPVQTSGVKVGRVANVVLQGVNNVMVYLEVNRAQRPHADAVALVASADFFGAKYVDYVPGGSDQMLKSDQVITGTQEAGVTEQAAQLTKRASDALSGVQTLLSQQTAEDIHQTLVAVERTLNVVAKIGEGPMVGQTQATLESVQRLANRMDSLIASPDLTGSMTQLNQATKNLKELSDGLSSSSNSLGAILTKINNGQGLLGQVVNDSSATGDVHDVLVSLKLLLDDIRLRPGRYTHISIFP
jgi:phospholipid/cholesterol/gamma-HCH transport system substrate-binding protein